MGVIGYREQNKERKYCLYDEEIKSDIKSGHPARFSPEDSFSKYRIEIKKEQNILPINN
ncbi:H/ACA ribonucleoprotein complex subunit 3 [Nematocida sp. LUAm3]|nr:H/ACA ribonucleoprotein complex subunit 3 [Nematocida sp. LUAm3]KAI5174660.1 H/ACA ribonucleoprotein complex subunit 3 [Nematocida sp. LUAm2]KAI5177779.1 H/ACA ribonucleoprotein complex subunit 3 [Nematocida sp. LUAm1]